MKGEKKYLNYFKLRLLNNIKELDVIGTLTNVWKLKFLYNCW